MKKGFMLFFVIMALLCTYGAAMAAPAAANFEIRAEILTPIQLVAVDILDFGRVFKGSDATTVDPTNPLAGTTPASFNVTGEANFNFVVTLPTEASISNGVDILTVNSFTTDLTNDQGALDATGNASFKVGGTLQSIDDTVSSGVYTGSATVTVAYLF